MRAEGGGRGESECGADSFYSTQFKEFERRKELAQKEEEELHT
jgi:hypothetical protein